MGKGWLSVAPEFTGAPPQLALNCTPTAGGRALSLEQLQLPPFSVQFGQQWKRRLCVPTLPHSTPKLQGCPSAARRQVSQTEGRLRAPAQPRAPPPLATPPYLHAQVGVAHGGHTRTQHLPVAALQRHLQRR